VRINRGIFSWTDSRPASCSRGRRPRQKLNAKNTRDGVHYATRTGKHYRRLPDQVFLINCRSVR
jgi:hypothetical protein